MQNILEGLLNEDYHARPEWSNSNLSVLEDWSPYHAYYDKYVAKREATPAMIKGTGIHTCVLEFERYEKNYIVYDGYKRGKAWDEFCQEHANKQIIDAKFDNDCRMTREAVMQHPKARALIESSQMVEPSAFAPLYGLPCKSRPDLITKHPFMVDLKSSQCARPDKWCNSIENYNYDRQAAFHHDVWAKAIGEYPDAYRMPYLWIVVESSEPYGVSVLECPDEMMLFGRRSYQQIIEVIQNCIEADHWPSYAESIMPAHYPVWSKRGGSIYG